MRIRIIALFASLIAALSSTGAAPAPQPVRVAVLKFGTVSWELDVLRHHRLDTAEGIALEVVELASGQAAKVALQAGAVDVIATDWLWVSRVRSAGGDKAKPIVLYCQADCWMSWNASKRASSWGYSNLYWFPEGDAGWKEAGNKLAEAKPVPVPVD